MKIESIGHKGLRRFFETGNPKGLVGDTGRLRKMLAFIDAAADLGELHTAELRPAPVDRGSKGDLVDDRDEKLAADVPHERRWCAYRYGIGGLSWLLKCIHR